MPVAGGAGPSRRFRRAAATDPAGLAREVGGGAGARPEVKSTMRAPDADSGILLAVFEY
jgi:hypothetical protein